MGKEDPPPNTSNGEPSAEFVHPEPEYSQQPPQPGYPQQPPQAGYPQQPPQAGYPQQPPYPGYPPTTNIIVTHISPVNLGPDPVTMVCPTCQHSIKTTVVSSPTTKTHLFAILCCIFFWPTFWIPYCIESCRGNRHTCPNCGSILGTYDG